MRGIFPVCRQWLVQEKGNTGEDALTLGRPAVRKGHVVGREDKGWRGKLHPAIAISEFSAAVTASCRILPQDERAHALSLCIPDTRPWHFLFSHCHYFFRGGLQLSANSFPLSASYRKMSLC